MLRLNLQIFHLRKYAKIYLVFFNETLCPKDFQSKTSNFPFWSLREISQIVKCYNTFCSTNTACYCYNMGQDDTIGKIELIPSSVLSSKIANSGNDIQ